MLSLDECRRHLGPCSDLSDEELVLLRDALYRLAEVAVEQTRCQRLPRMELEPCTKRQ